VLQRGLQRAIQTEFGAGLELPASLTAELKLYTNIYDNRQEVQGRVRGLPNHAPDVRRPRLVLSLRSGFVGTAIAVLEAIPVLRLQRTMIERVIETVVVVV
jgi:hypothetical protein